MKLPKIFSKIFFFISKVYFSFASNKTGYMTYKEKHNAADLGISQAYNRLIDNGERQYKILSKLSGTLGKSSPTIMNYIRGKGADGFLKEAIINELKNYKS